MVCSLFEGGQHENTVLHLGHTESSDTQHLALRTRSAKQEPFTWKFKYLVGHDISKQHNMPGINAHTVALHRELNFIDDGSSSSLNTQNLSSFDDVVGGRLFSDNSLCSHDLLETVAFDQQLLFTFLASPVIVLFNINDSTMNARDAL